MTKKHMGYPLPSGDAYTDELACLMLFYPDKKEYRQAFMNAYFYFGNWLAWQNDPEHKGADAARAWKAAIEVTLGCIEMNTCETILSLLAEIRDNTGVYCCDVMDISDGDQYTDVVDDGEGDVPQNIIDAGYADDAADWEGFAEYKCMISHVMVDNMLAQAQKVGTIIDESGAALVTVAVLAAIAAAILTAGGAILVAGIALGVASAAGLYAAFAEVGEAGMPDLLDAIDEHHDTLACAIYNADGSANAVLALKIAIDDEFNVVQAAFLKSLNLSAQLKGLYAGRYDAQDIAETMADEGYDVGDYDCTCPPAEASYFATFDSDDESWVSNPPDSVWWNLGNPAGSIKLHFTNGEIHINPSQLLTAAGLPSGDDIEIVLVTVDCRRPVTTNPDGCRVLFDGEFDALEIDQYGLVEDTYKVLEFQPSSPQLVEYNYEALRISPLGGTGGTLYVDNIRVWFNVV